ncbi:RNA 2',3'-cyclic phosphodiesterase [Candidatus Omnitrophota bacterium]
MSGQSIRTFIALEISDGVKEQISQIQEKFKQTESLKAKWVAKENVHLTLKFLGDTQLKHVEKIKDKLKECLQNEKAIDCNLSNIGVFPNERFTRVIWVSIKGGDAQIIDMAKKLDKTLCKLGFKKEKREFKTHITICRPKQILEYNQFKATLDKINRDFQPKSFSINKVSFFESKLTPQGPIYTSLLDVILQ